MADLTWKYQNFTSAEGPAEAVSFLNKAPREGPGEVSATPRNNGSVGLFFLDPGSLGTSTEPTWKYQNLTPAQGPAAAVTFLNVEANEIGSGLISAIARGDGSVGLFYLEPGGLSRGITPDYAYLNFTPAEGPAAAVAFLNEMGANRAGYASAYARDDGSVSLFYLNI